MLFVCEYHGGQIAQRTPPSIVRLLARLPRVLHEDVGRERPPLGERALADLGVVGEDAQCHVRDADPRPRRRAVVEKLEFAVLVVRAARNRVDVDLIEIVFARVLDRDAAFERVAALHLGRRVREHMDRPFRRRRIRPTVDARERVDRDTRDLVRISFLSGKMYG